MKKEKNLLHVFSSSGGETEAQDGPKEYLLCLECEGRFQRSEEYFARLMNQRGTFDVDVPDEGRKWIRISGLEYPKTKLFFMSLLWRSAVSRQHRRFQSRIGDTHESRLRDLLLRDDPGPPEEYGCVVVVPYLVFDGENSPMVRPPVSGTPDNSRWQHGLRLVTMQLDGLLLFFVVGALEVCRRSDARYLFVQQNGELIVGIENAMNISLLRETWAQQFPSLPKC